MKKELVTIAIVSAVFFTMAPSCGDNPPPAPSTPDVPTITTTTTTTPPVVTTTTVAPVPDPAHTDPAPVDPGAKPPVT